LVAERRVKLAHREDFDTGLSPLTLLSFWVRSGVFAHAELSAIVLR
jgi:hypothetical protein